jgi:hypothetical protein
MGKRTGDKVSPAPIVVGVVIKSANSKAAGSTTLKGVDVVSDVKQRRRVADIFLESARAMGVELPKSFKLMDGEIFYGKHGITEIRLSGAHIRDKKKGGNPELWSTRDAPKFTTGSGFELILSPQDRGRTYVAAHIRFGLLVLSWDVKANAQRRGGSHPVAGRRLIRITVDKSDKALDDEKEQYEIAIEYTQTIIDSILTLQRMLIKLRDGKVIEPMAVTLWALGSSFRRIFEPHFSEQTSGASWGRRLSMRKLSPRELKRRILDMIMNSARSQLRMERGRPPGSKNKKRRAEEQKKIDEWKKEILEAIAIVSKEASSKFKSEEIGEFKAEDMITKPAVIDQMLISRSTLYRWLSKGKLEFEELVNEVLRASKK